MRRAAKQTNASAPTNCKVTRLAKIRVLIADDHAVVREGLVAIIGRQPDMTVVAEASSGTEAVALWKQHCPDVALLDLRMPGLDGVGALEQIRSQDASARVIVLTTFDTDGDILRGLRAGARAYLLKDVPREDLLDCIRRVGAGEVVVPATVASKLAEFVGAKELSNREVEVLRLMAGGKSNKEIGSSLFIGETTVKSHVKGIFAKLNVLNRAEAIATASRRGLIRL
jgi:DNA-binding NarL/FixJ family response regulator